MTQALHTTDADWPPIEGGQADISAVQEESLPPAKPGPEEPRYTLLTVDDVINAPPMAWTVKGILPRRGVGQVYGASMSGKSFLLLSLAACIAEGKPWYGFRVKPTPVVYVVLEGEEGFRKRIRAMLQWDAHALSPDLHFIMQPFAINTAQDVAALSACVPRGALVIIDTQNASSPFVDENSTRDMGGIIDGAKTLARTVDGFVLLVAHTGKDTGRGPRGSSAQIPAWDCCLEVTYKEGRRAWIARKVKDGPDGQKFPFRLAIIDLGEDEDGDRITSCVAVPDEDTAVQDEGKPLSKSQQYALESLRIALEKSGTESVNVEDWRPHFYAGHTADNQESKRKAFERGRKDLVEKEYASVTNDYYTVISKNNRQDRPDKAGHLPDLSGGQTQHQDRTGQGSLDPVRCPGLVVEAKP